MIIELCNMSCDNRTVDKSPYMTLIETKNVVLKKDMENIKDFTMDFDTKISDWHTNYSYIPSLNRYYFLELSETPSNNITTVRFKQDTLMTKKNSIKNLTVLVERSEVYANGYLKDSQYPTLAYKKIATRKFPNGMVDDSIILMTIG